MFDFDVFVLGGGPAGLATAIAARRAGLTVMLADAEQPPIDKACGEGLMPDSLRAAKRLGIEIPRDAGYEFQGIRFEGARHAAAAQFPYGRGLGLRRTVLQPLLADAAANVGVDLHWRTPVTGIEANRIRFGKKAIEARWIIGADGSQSSVRRWAGIRFPNRRSSRFSYRRHYRIAPWSEFMEIHWNKGCQFYVTPVSPAEICVVLMTRTQNQRIDEALPMFRALQRRLRLAEPISSERGAAAHTRRMARVTRGNVALIGDASGTVDPITGEGLCLAFRQATSLASALEAEDLSQYEKAHHQICRQARFMARFMLLMDRSTVIQTRTMAAFEKDPGLFSNLLAMHVGQLSPVHFAATAAVLGWDMVSA
ncbi:MAG TPA: NAD(P)/FAD-dependent oxidoreductase [Bryobacteraceae bacterium]|jgi:flavin-dependent dehydrogenase|nr:NAD(P)/FAD-dependent oxidoreductase [Bryobacteraceae bacterium]